VIDDADSLHDLSRPAAVTMQSPSLSKFPAYSMSGVVVSKEKPNAAQMSGSSVLPREWEQTPQMVDVQTMMYQLVVRMKDVETDLCARINVPLKEFEGEAGAREMGFAKECMERIVGSLSIEDFGLFDA
jgi:hypothetical protein